MTDQVSGPNHRRAPTPGTPHPSLDQRNREVLTAIDPRLIRIYEAALAQEPRLCAVTIESCSSNEDSVLKYCCGHFTPPISRTDPLLVTLSSGDERELTQVVALRQRILATRYERLGLGSNPTQLDSFQHRAATLVHQLAHAAVFLRRLAENAGDLTRTIEDLRFEELRFRDTCYPLAEYGPLQLYQTQAAGEQSAFMRQHAGHHRLHGIESFEQLLAQTEEAYTYLPSETAAAAFAAQLLRADPQLLTSD